MGVSYREHLKAQRSKDKKALSAGRSKSLRRERAIPGAAFWAFHSAKPRRGPDTQAPSRQAAQTRLF